ncbi:MAG: phosphatase PAP2 family protein [Burkholderiales bacterium]|nr:phosphatase PAP2 family protein [Burkholderiales bacterium]
MHEIEPPPARHRWHRLAAVGAVLPLLLLWDASGLDLPLARWFGNADGFPLQYHPFLKEWLHEGARQMGWVVLALLCIGIRWPVGALKQLRRRERVWMVGTILLSLLVVVAIKGVSRTSCPWDLTEFGGTAQYVSNWAWGVRDGGGGHCFPAGHASTAFAFMSLAVWLRAVSPRAGAWAWAAVLAMGLLLGWAQQVRGAHFFSHTLWTAWLCWAVAVTLHTLTWRPADTARPCSPEGTSRR